MCGIMEWEVDHNDCKFVIVDPRDKAKRGVGLGTGGVTDGSQMRDGPDLWPDMFHKNEGG